MTETRAAQKANARKTPGERIQADIIAGKADEDLANIVNAVQKRIQSASIRTVWRAQLDGFDVSEETLTLDEAYRIELATGVNWSDIEPLRSASDARGVLSVLLQTRNNLTSAEADDRVAQLTVIETVAALSREVRTDAPLDTAASTTT